MMWWVTGQKNGASALGLQRILGLGGYQTAWSWLHKLRRAMVRPGREPLSGEVEVDETYVGGVRNGGGRRHLGHKALIVIAVEVRGPASGRIRLRSIPNASGPILQSFVRDTVAAGSVLRTDGWTSYLGLEEQGYRHRRLLQESLRDASKQLPRVHRVASLLKRWLLGTHQGRVERPHLPYYLDEFTFRFNRRSSRSRGLLFFRLAQQAVALDPVPQSPSCGRILHKQ
jgi:transposase-like protein